MAQMEPTYSEKLPPGDIDLWLLDTAYEHEVFDLLNDNGYYLTKRSAFATTFQDGNGLGDHVLPVQLISPTLQPNGKAKFGEPATVLDSFPITAQQFALIPSGGFADTYYTDAAIRHARYKIAIDTEQQPVPAVVSVFEKYRAKGFVPHWHALFMRYARNPIPEGMWTQVGTGYPDDPQPGTVNWTAGAMAGAWVVDMRNVVMEDNAVFPDQ